MAADPTLYSKPSGSKVTLHDTQCLGKFFFTSHRIMRKFQFSCRGRPSGSSFFEPKPKLEPTGKKTASI